MKIIVSFTLKKYKIKHNLKNDTKIRAKFKTKVTLANNSQNWKNFPRGGGPIYDVRIVKRKGCFTIYCTSTLLHTL
jgi:hypothetical protein